MSNVYLVELPSIEESFIKINTMALSSLLPAPLNKVFDKDDEKTIVKGNIVMELNKISKFMEFRNYLRCFKISKSHLSTSLFLFTVNLGALQNAKTTAPPYGSRRGFIPRSENDFGDGGAYPEIHVRKNMITIVLLFTE